MVYGVKRSCYLRIVWHFRMPIYVCWFLLSIFRKKGKWFCGISFFSFLGNTVIILQNAAVPMQHLVTFVCISYLYLI